MTHYANKAGIDSIIDFFGIQPSLPLHHQLVARSTSDVAKPKRLYFVSDGVCKLLQQDVREQLKITACGLKILERQEFKVPSHFSANHVLPQQARRLFAPCASDCCYAGHITVVPCR